MNLLHISIEYIAASPCRVLCQISLPARRHETHPYLLTLTSTDGRLWQGSLPVGDWAGSTAELRFQVMNQGKIIDEEVVGYSHRIRLPEHTDLCLHCAWRPSGDNACLYTTAFTECLFPFASNQVTPTSSRSDIEPETRPQSLLTLRLPEELPRGEGELRLTGNQPLLGDWNPAEALPLRRVGHYEYEVNLPLNELIFPLEYKVIVWNEATQTPLWEEGFNRRLERPFLQGGDVLVEETPVRIPQTQPRVAGLVAPVFSMRSRCSGGVGDFGSLSAMIDFVSSVGLRVLQILPINDTTRSGTWADSYPYNAISEYALHPMYFDQAAIKRLLPPEVYQTYETTCQACEDHDTVDYEVVNRVKEQLLREVYRMHFPRVSQTPAYRTFVKREAHWLWPYACYRFLQQHFGTSDFRQWPQFSHYQEQHLRRWITDQGHENEVNYHQFIQYELFTQLSSVHRKARRCGVILKGDIPIGVSRDSVSAWTHPTLFHFDGQAGAPPDFFSKDGQNWGFPTYHWENILLDDGRWWKDRLRYMAHFFDAYRIDHVLGFFRIWEIPYPLRSGMVGHFNPALPFDEQEIRCYGFRADIRVTSPSTHTEEEMKQSLFLAASEPNKCHPTIAGTSTEAFRALDENDRRAYEQLHNDYFYRRHDEYWTKLALHKLSLVTQATRMLPCAEDLGMIPTCMRTVLNSLHILSLEVESMPKYSWDRFADVQQNPYLSVDTITTHDMEPLRKWWKNHPDDAQTYYQSCLRRAQGEARPEVLTPGLASEIILRHLQSPSALCVLALQDWLAMAPRFCDSDADKEQINDPANSRHYWRYRMLFDIEKLKASPEIKQVFASVMNFSSRTIN